jgi:hypothetical protein
MNGSVSAALRWVGVAGAETFLLGKREAICAICDATLLRLDGAVWKTTK